MIKTDDPQTPGGVAAKQQTPQDVEISVRHGPEIEAYIKERLQPQIDWYEKASAKGKRGHFALSTVQLGATAAIPVVNTMTGLIEAKIATSILAGCAAIATGIAALGKHQENWTRYRRTASLLQETLHRFRHGVQPYNVEDRETLFIERVEDILRGEQEAWAIEVSKKPPSVHMPRQRAAQSIPKQKSSRARGGNKPRTASLPSAASPGPLGPTRRKQPARSD